MAKIGIVFSGGGARGFAHIGVLKVLKENNIHIDAIAGSSSGALIGAFYAHDQDPERIEKFALKIKTLNDIFDFSFSKTGLMKGEKVENYIKDYLQKPIADIIIAKDQKNPTKPDNMQFIRNMRIDNYIKDYLKKDASKIDYNFEDLKIPLIVNSTDIIDGTEVSFSTGPLVPALMASISYPGIFTTRKINDKIFVDGGVINPLPFHLLQGMDYIILVDVSRQKTKITKDSNFKDILIQSLAIMQNNIVENNLAKITSPHILIEPQVNERNEFDFKNVADAIKEGEKAANNMMNQLLHDISILDVGK